MDGHVEWIEAMINAYILVRNLQRKRSLDRPRLRKGGRGRGNKMGLEESGF